MKALHHRRPKSRHAVAVAQGFRTSRSDARSTTTTPSQYLNPKVELVAHDLYNGYGNSPDHFVGQFVPFSPDPKNPNWFNEYPVPFDTRRGIGCWVNSDSGDNITVVPAVECVLIANLRYSDFPKSAYRGTAFIRDYLVNELLRQFDDTYPANDRHTFVAPSQFQDKLFVWPDCNCVPEGITFAVAFGVPQLHESQLSELRRVVEERVFFAVAQMLLR